MISSRAFAVRALHDMMLRLDALDHSATHYAHSLASTTLANQNQMSGIGCTARAYYVCCYGPDSNEGALTQDSLDKTRESGVIGIISFNFSYLRLSNDNILRSLGIWQL